MCRQIIKCKMISIAPIGFALFLVSCYATPIAPEIHLRMMTAANKPISGIKGEYIAAPYPSLKEYHRRIPFQSDSKGLVALERQYVWSDILSRFSCHFLNIILPHGYSGPIAVINMDLSRHLVINPEKSSLTLTSTRRYDADLWRDFIFTADLNAKRNAGTSDLITFGENIEGKNYLSISVRKPNRIKSRTYNFVFDETSNQHNRQ